MKDNSPSASSFAAVALSPNLARAVDVLGYREMTPVQAQTLPLLLEGKDVAAWAQTGSGKTAAFGLAVLSVVDVAAAQTQGLVLCPTRELAEQVSGELRRLGRFIPNVRIVTLCGGVPARSQSPALEQPPQLVVGTPGRVRDHLQRGNLRLDALRIVVLDEADRLLDMGFLSEIEEIVGKTPRTRQTLLFSATHNPAVSEVSRRLQRAAVEITAQPSAELGEVEELFWEAAPSQKMPALITLLHEHQPSPALVFCHTKSDVRAVTDELTRRGFSALALHGELEQPRREEVLLRFAHQSCSVLVATDVAARGLDIAELGLVVSWELPEDPDIHVHRIGRTGRAGRVGRAVALCSSDEWPRARALEERLGRRLDWQPAPSRRIDAAPMPAPMVTLRIEGGRRDKLRPGDLLGALVAELGLSGEAVGKITVSASRAYVSIRRAEARSALGLVRERGGKLKVKGKALRVFSLP